MWLIYSILFVIHGSEAPFQPVVPQVADSVEDVIQKWQTASEESGERSGTFRVFEYNKVFRQEKRGVGRFELNATDNWKITFQPDPEVEAGIDHEHHGFTYQLAQWNQCSYSLDEGFITETNSREIHKVDVREKVIDLGFLFGKINLVEMMSPYRMVMFPHLSDSDFDDHKIEFGDLTKSDIHLIISPKSRALKSEYEKIELLLDRKTYITKAVKFFDSSDHKQTVYILHYQ